MKAIVVTDQTAGTAGMKLVERPEPQGAALASLSGANYGDVVVQVHASRLDPSAIELHDEHVSAYENRLIEPSPIQSRLSSWVTRSGRARPASRAMASW